MRDALFFIYSMLCMCIGMFMGASAAAVFGAEEEEEEDVSVLAVEDRVCAALLYTSCIG